MEDKWDYSVMREMQNRIRMLEMDNHLIKSQILSTNHEVRNAFIEFAEKMDRMERKLIQIFQPERSFRFSQFSDGSDAPTGFDAMAYVETVMHGMDQQSNSMQHNDAMMMQQDRQVINRRLVKKNGRRTTVLQAANPSRQVSPVKPPPVAEPAENLTHTNSQGGSSEGTSEGDKKFMFDCTVCGKQFRQSSGLSRHMRIHMRKKGYTVVNVEEPNVDSPSYDKRNRPKKFFCDYEGCEASFISRSGMTKHLKNVHPVPLPSPPAPKLQANARLPPSRNPSTSSSSNNSARSNINSNSNSNNNNNNVVVSKVQTRVNDDDVDAECSDDAQITSADLTPTKDDGLDDMYDDNVSQMSVTDDEDDKFENESDSPHGESRVSTPTSSP